MFETENFLQTLTLSIMEPVYPYLKQTLTPKPWSTIWPYFSHPVIQTNIFQAKCDNDLKTKLSVIG